jgi:hypothetical protein
MSLHFRSIGKKYLLKIRYADAHDRELGVFGRRRAR